MGPTYRERQGRQTVAIVVDGRKYELPPVDVIGDFDMATQYYKLHQRTPVDAVSEAAEELARNPAVSERMMARLFDALRTQGTALAVPSKAAVAEWLDTVDGLAFSLHLQLSRNYPAEFADPRQPGFDLAKLDFSQARQLVAKITREEYARLRDASTPEASAIVAAAAAVAVPPTPPTATETANPGRPRPVPAVVEGPAPVQPSPQRRSFAAAREG